MPFLIYLSHSQNANTWQNGFLSTNYWMNEQIVFQNLIKNIAFLEMTSNDFIKKSSVLLEPVEQTDVALKENLPRQWVWCIVCRYYLVIDKRDDKGLNSCNSFSSWSLNSFVKVSARNRSAEWPVGYQLRRLRVQALPLPVIFLPFFYTKTEVFLWDVNLLGK